MRELHGDERNEMERLRSRMDPAKSLQLAVATALGLPATWTVSTAAGSNEASAVTHVEDFSTYAGMGRILEAMRARGWCFSIQDSREDHRSVLAVFGPETDHYYSGVESPFGATADDAPAAVLKACAAALGVG